MRESSSDGDRYAGFPSHKDRRFILSKIYSRASERITGDVFLLHHLVLSTPFIPSGWESSLLESIIARYAADLHAAYEEMAPQAELDSRDLFGGWDYRSLVRIPRPDIDIDEYAGIIGTHLLLHVIKCVADANGMIVDQANSQFPTRSTIKGGVDFARITLVYPQGGGNDARINRVVVRYERGIEVYKLTFFAFPTPAPGSSALSFAEVKTLLDDPYAAFRVPEFTFLAAGGPALGFAEALRTRAGCSLATVITDLTGRHAHVQHFEGAPSVADASRLRAEVATYLLPSFLHAWRMLQVPVEYLLCQPNLGDVTQAIDRRAPQFAYRRELIQMCSDEKSDPMSLQSQDPKRVRHPLMRQMIYEILKGEDQIKPIVSRSIIRRDFDRVIFDLCKPVFLKVFGHNEIIGSRISDVAYYFSDFRLHGGKAVMAGTKPPEPQSGLVARELVDGHETFSLMIDAGLTTFQRGRVVHRLVDISTFRIAALLHDRAWRDVSPALVRLGSALDRSAQRLKRLHASGADNRKRRVKRWDATSNEVREILDEVKEIYADATALNAEVRGGITYRAVFARYYFDLVMDRLDSLREQKIADLYPMRTFLSHYLRLTVMTMERASFRYDALRRRCDEVLSLVRSWVELQQLEKINEATGENIRIQRAVELWALLPLGYYAWSIGDKVAGLLPTSTLHSWVLSPGSITPSAGGPMTSHAPSAAAVPHGGELIGGLFAGGLLLLYLLFVVFKVHRWLRRGWRRTVKEFQRSPQAEPTGRKGWH